MTLGVGLTDEDDVLDNLTIGQIEQAVRSRLRAARLYRESSGYWLAIRVLVVGSAFSTILFFHKPLHDPVSDVSDFAITWQNNYAGTHGGNANFVISSVSQAMDAFLDQYLRVNEGRLHQPPSCVADGARG